MKRELEQWTVFESKIEGTWIDPIGLKLDTERSISKGQLIAASPDLLAALKTTLGIAESWIHDQLDGTPSLDDALAELKPARDAIAKATRES